MYHQKIFIWDLNHVFKIITIFTNKQINLKLKSMDVCEKWFEKFGSFITTYTQMIDIKKDLIFDKQTVKKGRKWNFWMVNTASNLIYWIHLSNYLLVIGWYIQIDESQYKRRCNTFISLREMSIISRSDIDSHVRSSSHGCTWGTQFDSLSMVAMLL